MPNMQMMHNCSFLLIQMTEVASAAIHPPANPKYMPTCQSQHLQPQLYINVGR